ncbi:ThiF family protein [Cardiosporidium cionae]|uniref:SUMO-activating enzyme subunit n=1 Tax=Cardiosporidium cionae TaxID=476202 RepID=A0ABQ7JAN1_9APIC|nr:ThiF family protein [Cardiosporidium cionae]|eukprot:KAF8821057.1 ThiF family protein [Cardiosporidium cionae]
MLLDVFDTEIQKGIKSVNLLVVGAGGIGCELLKTLVLTGFKKIKIIDLDTIDVSNLNRQLLFRREHIGQSKADVAKQAVLQLRPDAEIESFRGLIQDSQFHSEWFKQFDVVLNALDNTEARRHVNRICIAMNIPLIEAGSAGYNGQVFCIKKNETVCYDCEVKPHQKSYPVCSIRQMPSKPEHCIAWAKLLFELFFGEENDKHMLSDLKLLLETPKSNDEIIEYGEKLFTYVFQTEIKKLLEMEDIWIGKPKPRPLAFIVNPKEESPFENKKNAPSYQKSSILSLKKSLTLGENIHLYQSAFNILYLKRNKTKECIQFDKEDVSSMNFVAAVANLRMYNFNMPLMSRWDIQSIAGAIIPAIASTNAIVAGLQVVQLLHILHHQLFPSVNNLTLRDSKAKHVWVNPCAMGSDSLHRGDVLLAEKLEPPNKRCFVCQETHIFIYLHKLSVWTLSHFVSTVIKKGIGCNHPSIDVESKNIYDDEETPENASWLAQCNASLLQWNINDGCFLTVTDFSQGDFQCTVVVKENPSLNEEEYPDLFYLTSTEPLDLNQKKRSLVEKEDTVLIISSPKRLKVRKSAENFNNPIDIEEIH